MRAQLMPHSISCELNFCYQEFYSPQLLHQAISSAILYDFYNYDADKKEFAQLFVKFTQVCVYFQIGYNC